MTRKHTTFIYSHTEPDLPDGENVLDFEKKVVKDA